MPFQGNGTFARVYRWQNDAANGLDIAADRFDAEDDGFAAGLSNCITRDGQSPPTAPIPWGNQNLTGVGALSGASYSFSGNGSVGGTLAVTGNVTFAGTLAVTGALTATGGLVAGTPISDGQTTPVQRPLGFLDMPLAGATTGRAIALLDRGFAIPATGNMTIPTNATTAFPVGSVVGIYNNSGSSITIAAVTPGTTTLRLGGSSTTGTRTLATRGYVVLWKVGTDEWVALNGGIS